MDREGDQIQIGDYFIRYHTDETVSITHKNGEGGSFNKIEVAKMLENAVAKFMSERL